MLNRGRKFLKISFFRLLAPAVGAMSLLKPSGVKIVEEIYCIPAFWMTADDAVSMAVMPYVIIRGPYNEL